MTSTRSPRGAVADDSTRHKGITAEPDSTSSPDTAGLPSAFDRGAGHYDLLVALNPGYHRHLRSAARELLARLPRRSDRPRLLDMACGTGASTRALVRTAPAGTRVTGVDFSAGMLDRARRKSWPPEVEFTIGDAIRLDAASLGGDQFDGAFASYLFRNVPPDDRDAALARVFEMVRPGGWLVTQEYSVAGNRAATTVWNLVSWLVIIPLGVLLDRNPRLYRYLWRSVREFDSRARFLRRLTEAGFVQAGARTVPGWQRGILHTFAARKPPTP